MLVIDALGRMSWKPQSQVSQSKSANSLAVGKLENAVKLEAEKLRLRGQAQEKQERLQRKGE